LSFISEHCILYMYTFFSCSGDLRDLHSFPTRRSSDLERLLCLTDTLRPAEVHAALALVGIPQLARAQVHRLSGGEFQRALLARRSEEHTSELQSRENLVCRLLLEKKKKCIIKCNQYQS